MTAYEHSWQVRQAHGFRVFDDAEVSEEFLVMPTSTSCAGST